MALLLLGSIGGCADDDRDPAGSGATVSAEALPGVYAGAFPCADCPAIDVRLWLRPDRAFFMRQSYREVDGVEGKRFYGLGRWRWNPGDGLLLTGAGPQRRFVMADTSRLEMQTETGLDHILIREPTTSAFSDQLTLHGEYVMGRNGPQFNECWTGLELPIASEGDHRRLERHYRSLAPRGQPALAIVEGRLKRVSRADATIELLVVEELVTVRPDARCPSPG